ncbi:L,D-transpeptidase [Prosthecobacter sp.]|uniref:L,D-transpeptidase n=1 Tax=Prosthecobacter sp. TaxID=1965333 RepID=UPI001DF92DF0|nr:L,D-transpeptidase [Prosthecobacter sp.]MCB1279013.1 L,D-transpeptidase [Prosthecobacter sp.]
MKPSLVILRAGLAAGTVLLASCQLFRKKPPAPPPEPVKEEWKYPGEWTGGDKPITSIRINVDVQRAILYNGNDVVGWTYVASGIPSFPTPTGEFKILEKIKDKVSNLYGKGYDANGKLVNSDFKQGRDLLPPGGRFEAAKMTYFMRLTGDGVGMHIGPIPRPGRRASHGCIRLPSKMAPILFAHTVVGTPVTITGSGPDYQSYLKQSNEKARANAAKLASAKKKAEEAAVQAAAATTLAPDDPNGPKGGTATPAAPTVPPLGAPVGTPATPTEEVKPAAPATPAPTPAPAPTPQ